MERIVSLEELKGNVVLDYVERALLVLEELELSRDNKEIVEEVLKWSETAKCGLRNHRESWAQKGYNLFAHNVGSA